MTEGRNLKVRVKAGGRTQASRRWLERQLNDPYVARAKREGFRSRAAYKLVEIDDKHQLLKAGGKVVDLGAAPGGWAQVAAKRVRAGEGGGRVVAIDLLDIEPMPGVEFVQLDFMAATRRTGSRPCWVGRPTSCSPTWRPTPPAIGRPTTSRSWALAEAAAEFAREVLKPGGAFLARCCKAAPRGQLLASLKRDFASVKHVKPAASRADSAELYLLATGFRAR